MKQPIHKSTSPMSFWPQWHENKPFALVLLIIGAFMIVFLRAKIEFVMQQTHQLNQAPLIEHDITVQGQGKAIAKTDIATVTLGVDTKAADVATAQTQNSTTMNGLLDKVKALGISADDIQTSNYNVYPNTIWNPSTQMQETDGWIVSQTITIKVRDTSKVSSLLSVAGQNGATSVSGPSFTVDDTSTVNAEARANAIADAKKQADALAQALGVKIDTVVGYSESTGGIGPFPYAMMDSTKSVGGAAPVVSPGTNEVDMTVSITYKLAR